MKKIVMLFMALSIATILTACGGDDSAKKDEGNKKEDKQTEGKQTEEKEQTAAKKIEITDEEKVEKDKVVVKVNGTDVKGRTYNATYAQTKFQMNQSKQDVSNTKKVKEQTINAIVQQELLKQEAKAKGIEVTEKEVKAQYKKEKSSFKGDFAKALKQNYLTEESYKEQIELRLTVQKYAAAELNTEVTEKEVQAYYDRIKKQQAEAPEAKQKEVPKLEEIKGQIKKQLKQQKEQQQLQATLQKLKKQAEIKNMI